MLTQSLSHAYDYGKVEHSSKRVIGDLWEDFLVGIQRRSTLKSHPLILGHHGGVVAFRQDRRGWF